MKIYLDHLTKHINQKVDFNDLSEKLFQLGHEHELKDNILGYIPDENISFKIDFNGDLCTLKNLITAT